MSGASEYGTHQLTARESEMLGGSIEPRRHWWDRWTQLTGKHSSDEAYASLAERELLRRSQLLSWILLGMFAVELLLLVLDSSDTATLLSVAIALVGTIGAALLNRMGYVTAAGVLLVLLVIAAVMGAVTNSPGHILDTIYLPAYDLLAIAVIIAASVLPRVAAFYVAALSIALICVDYFLQTKGPDLLHQQQMNGALSMIARPIVLQVIVATVAFLWVRGAEEAIRRADRAEELAALEHAFAEQRRQLEVGVQQILETHVRVANGDFAARAPMNHDNLLWQIAASLNNLLSRLQKSGQAEYQLRRTEEEVHRLVAAIDDARQRRHPIWPAPTGTVADLLIERIVGTNRPLAPRGLGRMDLQQMPYDDSMPMQTPAAQTPAPQTPAAQTPVPQSQGQYATGALGTPTGESPAIPHQETPAFRPPHLEPIEDGEDSAPTRPTMVPNARSDGEVAAHDVAGLPPLSQAPAPAMEHREDDGEIVRAADHWPDLLHERAEETGNAAKAPAKGDPLPPPPPNPYADLWEMPVES